jgi:hypothetical protein
MQGREGWASHRTEAPDDLPGDEEVPEGIRRTTSQPRKSRVLRLAQRAINGVAQPEAVDHRILDRLCSATNIIGHPWVLLSCQGRGISRS